MDKELFSVEETSQILKIHPRTLRRYIKEGKISAQKLGGQWRISKEIISTFLDAPESKERMKKCNNSDINNFINENSQVTEGKIQICSIIDYHVNSQEEINLICQELLSIVNSKENFGKMKFDFLYVPEEKKARFTLWGNPVLMSKIMDCLKNKI